VRVCFSGKEKFAAGGSKGGIVCAIPISDAIAKKQAVRATARFRN
jgi:hypothetical protein